jgi:hypothetical protein
MGRRKLEQASGVGEVLLQPESQTAAAVLTGTTPGWRMQKKTRNINDAHMSDKNMLQGGFAGFYSETLHGAGFDEP